MRKIIFKNKTVRNVLKVSFSNLAKLLSGVLVAFLLPKMIGVTDYGYYKTFTLYASYTGLLHFGFADGIYLKYGGTNYDKLNKQSFRSYSLFFIVTEIAVTGIFAFLSLIFISGELRFIFVCLAVFALSSNLVYYYQIISQITERFGELSLRNIIQSLLTVVSLLLLFGFYICHKQQVSYRAYTVIYVLITVLLTFWYIWTYRGITFGKTDHPATVLKECLILFKIGFPLLVANLSQSLVLSIDRQFVNVLFDTNTYAVYAFAYNMLSLMTTTLSAISTVLFPILKKTNENDLRSFYAFLVEVVLILACFSLLLYFPLSVFVQWFLPKYAESIVIFRIIMPGLIMSSAVTLIMHNYYKVVGKEGVFFCISVLVLALSIVANVIAYSVFGTAKAISVASVFVLLIWYICSEAFFVRKYHVKWFKNFIYSILMIAAFYGISAIGVWWLAMVLYLCAFVLATLFLFMGDLGKIKGGLFNGEGLANGEE